MAMLPATHDDIDRYGRYLLEVFGGDPRLARCRGAAPADLAEIRRVAGRGLPSLYVGYLERFGGDDGPIALCDDCSSSAAGVLRYLASSARREYSVIPPDSVLIGVRALSFARSLWFAQGEGEPKVIINDCERVDRVIADSFGTYLYRQTWLHRYFHRRSVTLSTPASTRLSEVSAMLAGLGYAPSFFSDAHQFAGERVEDAMRVTAFHDPLGLWVHVAGDEREPMAAAGEQIRRALERLG